jgi:hypothetical protein
MQDLSALEKTVSGLGKSLETGGVLLFLSILAILTYLLISAWMKTRKATQSMNINLGKPMSSYEAGRAAVWSKQLDGLESSAAAAALLHVDHSNKLSTLSGCGQAQTDVLSRMDKKLGQLVLMEKLRNGFPKDIDVEEILK